MIRWNNCLLVYLNGKIISSNKFVRKAINVYKNKIKKDPEYNVWYDFFSKKCFGIDSDIYLQYYPTSGKCFESRADSYFKKKMKKKFESLVLVKNKEIFYTHTGLLDKFKDSSVLIVGGGPSTNCVKWENIKTDYIWTCNHFFLHPKLSKKNVDLAVLGDEVNLSTKNEKLHSYCERHQIACVFESIANDNLEFNSKFPHQCHYMYSKYRSKIGTTPREIILALTLGVKEIFFVGIDGLKENGLAKHSFEIGKKPRGTRGYDLFRCQYVVFWDYILNYLKPDTKFYNLGEEVISENMTTNISLQKFPLSPEIKRLIN